MEVGILGIFDANYAFFSYFNLTYSPNYSIIKSY